MRKSLLLAVVAFFFMCGIAWSASNATFTWDSNSESDLAGYRLYQSQTSGVYTFGDGNQVATILAGIETVQIIDIPDGVYFWVLTAYDADGNESGPSNEVTANLDTLAPNAPATITITIIIKVQ